MSPVDELTPAALSLPVEDRALLAERLLASLDDLDEIESDRLWGEEALRRLVAHRDGRARARPAAEVYASAERLLGALGPAGTTDTDSRFLCVVRLKPVARKRPPAVECRRDGDWRQFQL